MAKIFGRNNGGNTLIGKLEVAEANYTNTAVNKTEERQSLLDAAFEADVASKVADEKARATAQALRILADANVEV